MSKLVASLKPYISVLLLQNRRSSNLSNKKLFDWAKSELNFNTPPGRYSIMQESKKPTSAAGLQFRALHYKEEREVTWTTDQKIKNVINHLVLVGVGGEFGVVLTTDSSKTALLSSALSSSNSFKQIDAGFLNAAFARGEARTLWLSGVHNQTKLKADSKVLSGIDLRDALDPMADQSYYFTALRARGVLNSKNVTVGLSPAKSRAWIGPTKDWTDCAAILSALLDKLNHTSSAGQKLDKPIETLASTCTDATAIQSAFEATLFAFDAAAEDLEPDEFDFLEEWREDGSFNNVTGTPGVDFEAEAVLNGTLLGKLEFKVDTANLQRIGMSVISKPEPGQVDRIRHLETLITRHHYLQVAYESGHCIAGRNVFEQTYRDVRFSGWLWRDFTGYNLHKEKPVDNANAFDPTEIGNQYSLFCWVKNETAWGKSGWLACDDGGGEMADFIHWNGNDTFTLIHIKAAKKPKNKTYKPGAGREVSATDYEVVTAQAIKNLRNLNMDNVVAGLISGLNNQNSDSVWNNGQKTDRKALLASLPQKIRRPQRKVVVIQPRVMWKAYDDDSKSLDANTLAQKKRLTLLKLETILVNTRNACQALEATFEVIADGS